MRTLSQEEIREWMVTKVAETLSVDREDIPMDLPLDEIGLDSVAAVTLSTELSVKLDCDLPGTILYEYPTINELSQHLSGIAGRM